LQKDNRDIDVVSEIAKVIKRRFTRYLREYANLNLYVKHYKNIFGKYYFSKSWASSSAEDVAYSEVLLGNYRMATQVIEQGFVSLEREYIENSDEHSDKDLLKSYQETEARLRQIKSLVVANPSIAQKQIKEWINYTMSALKLIS
jgi:hypothetical protein